jgi:hypothetical protein
VEVQRIGDRPDRDKRSVPSFSTVPRSGQASCKVQGGRHKERGTLQAKVTRLPIVKLFTNAVFSCVALVGASVQRRGRSANKPPQLTTLTPASP